MGISRDGIRPQGTDGDLRMLEEDRKKTLTMYRSGQYSGIVRLYYVSDLHLDMKLRIQYPCPEEYGNEEMERYVEEAADRIIPPLSPEIQYDDQPVKPDSLVLLCGDVAADPEVLKAFLQVFSWRVQEYGGNLVFIMGNHEHSRIDPENPARNIDIGVVENDYRAFCQSHDVIFLHNELLLYCGGNNMILDTRSILDSSDVQLAEVCSDSDVIVFGGTGYEKKDPYHGLIKGTRITEEIIADHARDTDIFKNVYRRLLDVFRNDDRIVVMTHYPPSAWADGPVCGNWVYFHGHTHQENFVFSDTMKIFGDNQWGHTGTKDGLKYYSKGFRTDIFAHCGDGIYEVSRGKYLSFYRHLGRCCEMNREGQILMLKRQGFYLFLHRDGGNRLKLLEGGRMHSLGNGSLAYFYDNMVYMAQKMLKGTLDIRKQMVSVSEYVRGFGGTGTVHGCIVDIDFSSHLYVNPYDGMVTPYFAVDMVNKIVYPDLRLLLLNHVPALVGSYDSSIGGQKSPMKISGAVEQDACGTAYKETDIYAISNKLRNAQYVAECNIVRYWIPDEVTEANLSDRTIDVLDYDALSESRPEPRKPFVLSTDSCRCLLQLDKKIHRNLSKGEFSKAALKEIIRECCLEMKDYDAAGIDSTVDSLFSKVLAAMKDCGIAIAKGTSRPAVAENSGVQLQTVDWKQIYDALNYLQLDLSDRILDYLQTEDGASMGYALGFNASGKRINDLKKVYRMFILGNKGGTFIKDENGDFTFYKPGREDVDEVVNAYIGSLLPPELPHCEKISCPTGYFPEAYRNYGFEVPHAFKNLLKVLCISNIDWLSDVLKLLCASILRERYKDPGAAIHIESFLYSENCEFDRYFQIFAEDPILSNAWALLFKDKQAVDYLKEHAMVFRI